MNRKVVFVVFVGLLAAALFYFGVNMFAQAPELAKEAGKAASEGANNATNAAINANLSLVDQVKLYYEANKKEVLATVVPLFGLFVALLVFYEEDGGPGPGNN